MQHEHLDPVSLREYAVREERGGERLANRIAHLPLEVCCARLEAHVRACALEGLGFGHF